MDFGIGIPTASDSWKLAQRAEEAGFTHAWFYDTQMITADCFTAMGAAAMAHMGMFPESVGAGPTSDLGSRLWKMYTDGLERLVEAGKAGATGTTGTATSARSYQVDNPTETAAQSSLFPRAKVF